MLYVVVPVASQFFFMLLFNDAFEDVVWEMFQFTPTNPSENQIPKTFRDGTKGHDFHPFDYLLSHQNKSDTMGPNHLKKFINIKKRGRSLVICSLDGFTNLVFMNPKFASPNLLVVFDLLKTDFCLRVKIYKK